VQTCITLLPAAKGVQICNMLLPAAAVLKAGGAYLPMDPHYPEQRLAYMVKDAKAPVLLTHQGLRRKLPEGDLDMQVTHHLQHTGFHTFPLSFA